MRLGILGSTRGTNLKYLLDAIHHQKLIASIEVVVSNKKDAGILTLAKNANLSTEFIHPGDLTRDRYDEKISQLLIEKACDLIILIGYMRILSNVFINTWRNKIINVHPSLLPAFAGKMDLAVHQAVLDAGEIETGCTVHYVTEEVDAGPILLQKVCPVYSTDTAEILKTRVQQLEGPALIEVVNLLLHNQKPMSSQRKLGSSKL